MGLTGAVAAAMLALQAGGGSHPLPRVLLTTDLGPVLIELDAASAPVTACNFIRYAAGGLYDGGSFFRSVEGSIHVVQAATVHGSDDPGFGPIALERTRETGLSHVAGAVSMARDGPDTATSSFFVVTRDSPSLDFGGARNPDGQGFAVFGRVVQGLELFAQMQARPTVDEQIQPPVALLSARLLDPAPAFCS